MKWTALLLVGLALFLVSPLASAQALPTADLTELEKKVQGVWRDGYTIVIEGRNFCADTTRGEWYEGKIVIREDTEPKQFDFVIENCACGFSPTWIALDATGWSCSSSVPRNFRSKPRAGIATRISRSEREFTTVTVTGSSTGLKPRYRTLSV